MSRNVLALLLLLCAAPSAIAQSIEGEPVADAVGIRTSAAPAPLLAKRAQTPPAIELSASATSMPEALEEIARWNAANRLPARNGFTRALPETIAVRLGTTAAAKSGPAPFARGVLAASPRGLVWSGVIAVDGAERFRIHLRDVSLPEDATLWISSDASAPVAFGAELVDDEGGLWTPPVRGPRAYLEIESQAGAAFAMDAVAELVTPRLAADADDTSCLADASCQTATVFPALEDARRGIGQLEYMKNGSAYVCTGGLLNDTDPSTTIPYLLTANHCISTASSAASLVVTWDFRTSSCQGAVPDFHGLPSSRGATILATNANSDFTLLRLNAIPGNRYLLGWNANLSAIATGTQLYRVSYPAPNGIVQTQMYSRRVIDAFTDECDSQTGSVWSRPQSIYSVDGFGGTYGGSSGSPTLLANGQVVGQLHGYCGEDPANGCDLTNYTVDGSFAVSFPSIEKYLAPPKLRRRAAAH
jgi:lysyl endopeptidase